MSDFSYNKIDFIIIIVLALLVAFIIGFNIIQIVDTKLSSVIINVPPQNCNIPPIYLNIDKDSNIKQIKLNDIISTTSNESQMNLTNNKNDIIEEIEGFNNIEDYEKINNKEDFGNIKDYPDKYDSNNLHIMTGILNSDMGNKLINNQTIYTNTKDQNYNTVNNIPLLFAPDTDVPNRAGFSEPHKNSQGKFIRGPDSKGYYSSKVKLIEDTSSPLMKLYKQNFDKINSTVAKSTLENRKRVPEVNGTFDGYNSFVDLRSDSYANVTSIGKSMLTPYTSYPVPS